MLDSTSGIAVALPLAIFAGGSPACASNVAKTVSVCGVVQKLAAGYAFAPFESLDHSPVPL